MTKRKFSKQVVIDQLTQQIDHLAKLRGFTTDTGWVQVKGKGEAANRDYGQWHYCVLLREWIIDGSLS